MATLLRIDASARTENSHSRCLADTVEALWLKAHPGGELVVRDLVTQPVAYITDETINGFYTAPDDMSDALRQATALSDELIAELLAADSLLLSVPMYNFSVPAVLKAWIDQVVRINHTFAIDENGLSGLIKDKQAYVTTAIGAQFSGTPLEAYDFLRPYLKSLLGFLGFEKIEMFSVESTTMDEQQFKLNQQEVTQTIKQAFADNGVVAA